MSFRTALRYFINRLKIRILICFKRFVKRRTAKKKKLIPLAKEGVLKSTMILILIKK
jgi:hypothetical protein